MGEQWYVLCKERESAFAAETIFCCCTTQLEAEELARKWSAESAEWMYYVLPESDPAVQDCLATN